jgi:threonine synthase
MEFGKEERILRCAACGGELEAAYDYDRAADFFEAMRRTPLSSIWDFLPMLPMTQRTAVVTLGEGWTPLVKAERLGRKIGIRNLYLKDETRNPTLSFKDRAISVAVSKAVEWKKDTLVTASTGNLAAAVSAYAARAGLKAFILTASSTPLVKRVQTAAFGATVVPVQGATTDSARYLADRLVQEYDWYPAMTHSSANPFTLEGAKTSAYEIYFQMKNRFPDWMLLGVGGGENLAGHWKGFRELISGGETGDLPRMVGVQAATCAPFVEAVVKNLSFEEIKPWRSARTIASGLADAYPADARLGLRAIGESKGRGIAVSDADLLEAVVLMAEQEGIFAEPSGGAGLAAARKLREEGTIDGSDTVVCEVTGSGLKQYDELSRSMKFKKPIRGNLRAFEETYLK